MKTTPDIVKIILIFLAVVLHVSPSETFAGPSKEVQNLRAFAKLYGYTKYFHPSDEAAAVDWDAFAVYGAGKVKGAKNSGELQAALESLFKPIAPTIEIHQSDKPAPPPSVTKETEGLKVVAWQHHGLGLGNRGPYASVRVNRPNERRVPGEGFGTVTQYVDASAHQGKDIKLSAFVRAEVRGSGNQGQLWLRVDRPDKQMGFFNNMDDRPIKSGEWKRYEIVGTVAEDATMVAFGGFLKGEGKAWVDDFKLEVKGETGEWEPIGLKNPGFETDSGDKPSGWGAGSPGYSYKVGSESPAAGERCVLIESKTETASGEKLFDKMPGISEVIQKELGRGLSCQVRLALYGDEDGTRPAADRAAVEALTAQLKAPADVEYSAGDEAVRLGGVVIAWNVFQHFYPYFDVVQTDWDRELTLALERALSDETAEDFHKTLKRLVAALHDGHGGVYAGEAERAGFPFTVDWIEGEVVITTSDDGWYEVGDVVESINGVKAEKLLRADEELISGSPQWKRYRALRSFAWGEYGSVVDLKVKRDGRTVNINAGRLAKKLRYEVPKPGPLEEIEPGVFYVNLSIVTMDSIQKRMKDIAAAKGVIFDLRGYPNGNHEVISHLLTAPDTSSAWMQVPETIYPDGENRAGWTRHGWHMTKLTPHIDGKVVFITDGRAISYAESFMGLVEHYKLGEIVGQPTAGTNGNVNPFSLPGGYRVAWTGMRVVKHDGSQHHLIGIRPTVPASRTIQGVLDGRDEFLEKALEVVRPASED